MLDGRFARSYSRPRVVLIHLPLSGALNARLVLVSNVLVKTRVHVFRHLDPYATACGMRWNLGGAVALWQGRLPTSGEALHPSKELVGALNLHPDKGACWGLESSSWQGSLSGSCTW